MLLQHCDVTEKLIPERAGIWKFGKGSSHKKTHQGRIFTFEQVQPQDPCTHVAPRNFLPVGYKAKNKYALGKMAAVLMALVGKLIKFLQSLTPVKKRHYGRAWMH